MTPTARTLAHLRADGWHAEVVEHRVPRTNITRDLWGFVDVLAIRDGQILAVQVTSASNVAARLRKIAESPLVGAVRECGIAIHVHGWRKHAKTGRWLLRIEDVS